jgi:S-adenosylmethionine decarboxylase
MIESSRGFGVHLMLDLGQCAPARLSDLDGIFRLLDALPDMLGMTKVAPPYVFRYSGKVPEDKGITGFVVIAESHCSIHTFQEKGYAFVDIFSCKAFDCDKAEQQIINALVPRKVTRKSAARGIEFPRSNTGGIE